MDKVKPPTGTYDDLLALLAQAESQKQKSAFKGSRCFASIFESAFISSGRLLAAAMRLGPEQLMFQVQDWGLKFLAGSYACPRDVGPSWRRSQKLVREVSLDGKPLSLVCLISHPPAAGDSAHWNVELMRHALQALRLLRGRSCRPRMLVAIDDFALDMLGSISRGLYAGFMAGCHLAVDRLLHARQALGRSIVADSAWPSLAWRLTRYLRGGGELGMVLAGGVPATSRILYATREFLLRLRQARPVEIAPSQALARLRAQHADFSDFFQTGLIGDALRRNAWRMMEAWVISRMTQEGAFSLAKQGALAPSARLALLACAGALGYGPEQAQEYIASFEQEYARQTPYRERFFNFLACQVIGHGTRMVLLPVIHGPRPTQIQIKDAVALMGYSQSQRLLRLIKYERERRTETDMPVPQFAREFVASNFY